MMSSLQPKHIQVCCRIRGSEVGEPTVTSYLNNDAKDGKSYEVATSTGSFQMDYAFDNGDSQDCIFEQIVQPMLSDAFTGFNCSLFSYGQTGSGKTYTLIGNIAGGGPAVLENKDRGIIPRAAEEIFCKQAALDPQKVTCQIKLAILEVYQEQLKDLIGMGGSNSSLSHSTSRENLSTTTAGMSVPTLKIREQIDGTVWVEGLTELVVTTPGDFNRILMNALKRRVVGAHAMNDTSSRSHFCCILNVHQVFHATGVKINSKIHFIDLAGSEMVRKTDTSGVRFDEAKHINKSLSALGNVIYALSAPAKGTTDAIHGTSHTGGGHSNGNKDSNGDAAQTPHRKHSVNASGSTTSAASTPTHSQSNNNKAHIPYRDSKLTRLLQNSLGGNAKTVIILTISDAKKHFQETLSTLRFGARARSIVIKPIVNKSVLEDQNLMKKQYSKMVQENRELQDLVAQLQAELHSVKDNSDTNNTTNHSVDNGHPNGVCEICNNFLDLKLRNGHDYKPYSQENTVARVPSTIKEPPTTQTTTKPTRTVPSIHVDTTLPAASDDYNDIDYDIPEPLDRCAICGLSASEAEKLEMYTGEMLGEMFSCDGNCGHQFHVRCVGLLGEGGQYALPEGEWFCTECYSGNTIDDNSPVHSHMSAAEGMNEDNISSSSGIADVGRDGDNYAEYTDDNNSDLPLRPRSSHHDLSTLTTDPVTIAHQSHRIAPNKTPSSVLATIKAEYHTMRKERNRILAQWQTEKKIIEKYEITRRIEQQKRDQELVNAKQMITKLEEMVTQGEKQSERMQKLFDVMLKELQQSTASLTTSSLSPNNSSNAIKNSVDRLKWASMTVESLLDMPIDSITHHQRSPKHTLTHTTDTTTPTSGTKVSTLQHSNSSPTIPTAPSLHTTSTLQLATEASGPYANTNAGIPKPWTGKVRTGANNNNPGNAASTTNTNNLATGYNSKLPSTNGTSHTPNHKTTNEGSNTSGSAGSLLKPPRYSADPALNATTDTNASTATYRNSLTSQDARDYSGGATVSSIADSDSRRSSFHSHSSTDSSPDQSTLEHSNKRKLPENLQQDITGSKGKSKFINPLKNRLKDLLKSVEAETDAFAEIRQKFKSREDERNLLRSSQGDR